MKGCYEQCNKGLAYRFWRLFYTEPQFYLFDESVIQLEMKLRNLKFYKTLKLLLILAIPIYYVICIFSPVYFTIKAKLMESCGVGLSWDSYWIYGIFAVCTLAIEYFLYIYILQSVSHLILPMPIPPPTTTISLLLTKLKQLTNQHRKLLFILSFFNS